MAQSVVYADLKFVARPPSTAPDDDDSPYENVSPLGLVTAEPSPGRWTRPWRVPTVLLVASLLLLLLLLVAVVALGVCHWQVTRSLQDSSREHKAEQGRLSQELRAQEQSLEQTQLELAWARAELQRAWHEGNISQLELDRLSLELRRITGVLGRTEREMQEVQGRLNSSERAVSSLRACVNTDCCPSGGWVLFKSKCLFISVKNKTWEQSRDDCERRSAQLLVQDEWSPWTVPYFVHASKAYYWIGGKPPYVARRSMWMESKHASKRHSPDCWSLVLGEMWNQPCNKPYPWICEKSPNLSRVPEPRPLFLGED
ncbi:B-cell differentiation antigen CD72-like [Zonotrichia albicollis]|uniref:B-cell differentiation antigen CD72-like n=1 Tax=Zonotrichia albicollis TaxID=44394 RepID=UPI003D80F9F4